MPLASVAVPTAAAEFVQVPPTGTVASSLTVTEVCVPWVNGLLIRSSRPDSDARPSGVTGHEQHDTISSSGANTKTFAQIEPVRPAELPEARPAPDAPELLTSTKESPLSRFER